MEVPRLYMALGCRYTCRIQEPRQRKTPRPFRASEHHPTPGEP